MGKTSKTYVHLGCTTYIGLEVQGHSEKNIIPYMNV